MRRVRDGRALEGPAGLSARAARRATMGAAMPPGETQNYAPNDLASGPHEHAAAFMLIAFNKPYGVLSQFTSDDDKPTLAPYIDTPGVYAAGRLDFDSEGLLLLTDDGRLQHAIANAAERLPKSYWVQVEGVPSQAVLDRFATGIAVGDGRHAYRAAPAAARRIEEPGVGERVPPIRVRARIPTSWIEVTLTEGRNRQIRRMTAAVGHPTLRLMRVRIGTIDLFHLGIAPGVSTAIKVDRLGLASVAPARTIRGGAVRTRSGGARLSTGIRSRR
jgi:23S rRNA pseudouridine2457 synthase